MGVTLSQEKKQSLEYFKDIVIAIFEVGIHHSNVDEDIIGRFMLCRNNIDDADGLILYELAKMWHASMCNLGKHEDFDTFIYAFSSIDIKIPILSVDDIVKATTSLSKENQLYVMKLVYGSVEQTNFLFDATN